MSGCNSSLSFLAFDPPEPSSPEDEQSQLSQLFPIHQILQTLSCLCGRLLDLRSSGTPPSIPDVLSPVPDKHALQPVDTQPMCGVIPPQLQDCIFLH